MQLRYPEHINFHLTNNGIPRNRFIRHYRPQAPIFVHFMDKTLWKEVDALNTKRNECCRLA